MKNLVFWANTEKNRKKSNIDSVFLHNQGRETDECSFSGTAGTITPLRNNFFLVSG
jgi:hypothetical protein